MKKIAYKLLKELPTITVGTIMNEADWMASQYHFTANDLAEKIDWFEVAPFVETWDTIKMEFEKLNIIPESMLGLFIADMASKYEVPVLKIK